MAARKYKEAEFVEVVETVMTFKEWEKLHYQQLEEWKKEMFYYVKQKAVGLLFVLIGIIIPFLADGDATASLLILPLGLYLLITKKKMIIFD